MKNLDYKGFKSTRLIVALVIFAVGTALLGFGKIEGPTWMQLVTWVFGTYAVSEAGAKGAEAMRDRGAPPA